MLMLKSEKVAPEAVGPSMITDIKGFRESFKETNLRRSSN